MKTNSLKEQKDQGIRSEMTPKLVWYFQQNIQHEVSHTLQDLLPSIFLLHTHWSICMRRWRTLVELQFVKKKTKNTKP